MISIRKEQSKDVAAIRTLNELTFHGSVEADIVDALRKAPAGLLSLVAVENGSIVGHLAFSPVMIETTNGTVTSMGLGPMAVLPDHQQQGIGSALVWHCLFLLRKQRCPFVIVLGHPTYHPRFGFVPASQQGLTCQWDGVPDEAFMVLVLDTDRMKDIDGIAKYQDEFNMAM